MSDLRRDAEQTGVLVWGSVAGKLAEAIAPIVIARILGKADYGAFGALLVVYSTITVIVTAGLPKGVLYFLAGRSDPQRRAITSRLLTALTLIGIAAGALIVVVGVFGAPALARFGAFISGAPGGGSGVADGLRWLPILGIYAVVDVPSRMLPHLCIAEGRPRTAALAGVVRSVGTLLGTLVPAAAGWGVGAMAMGLVVFGTANLVFFFALVAAIYRGVPRQAPELGLREILRYALPLGGSEIVSVLNARFDQWLILLWFPIERLAEYRNGAWQIPVLTTVAYSLAAVQLPRLTKLLRSEETDDRTAGTAEALAIWRRSALKVSLIVVPAGITMAVCATELMVLAFGERYAASGPVFACYAVLTAGRITGFGTFLVAAGRPRDVLRASAWTLLANVLISVPLTWGLGFIGPALGTALAFVPAVLIYCVYIARAASVPLRETFPLRGYFAVVASCLPGVAVAVGLRHWLEPGPGGALGLGALSILGGFVLVGRVAGVVTRDDLTFARDWLRMKVLRTG